MPEIQNLWPGANPVTVRASAVLLGDSAYDASPTEFSTANCSYITFYITYTRGGQGGAVSMHFEYSPRAADAVGVENWFRMQCDGCETGQAGSDATVTLQRSTVIYTSTGDGAENVVFGPIEFEGTVERMRVACSETGAAGKPGTVHIVAYMT